MRRAVLFTCFVTLVGFTASCHSGGDDQGQPSTELPTQTIAPSTTSPDPTPIPSSPSPTPSATPTPPADIHDHSRAGAKATAEYWVMAMGEAYGSGDTKPLKAISAPTCDLCNGIIESVDKDVAKGIQLSVAKPYRVVSYDLKSYAGNSAAANVRIFIGQGIHYDPHTKRTTKGAPSQIIKTEIDLVWTSQQWQAKEVYKVVSK